MFYLENVLLKSKSISASNRGLYLELQDAFDELERTNRPKPNSIQTNEIANLLSRLRIDEPEPPERYQDIDIYPRPDDLMATEPPYLRANITKGNILTHITFIRPNLKFKIKSEIFILSMTEPSYHHISNMCSDIICILTILGF